MSTLRLNAIHSINKVNNAVKSVRKRTPVSDIGHIARFLNIAKNLSNGRGTSCVIRGRRSAAKKLSGGGQLTCDCGRIGRMTVIQSKSEYRR